MTSVCNVMIQRGSCEIVAFTMTWCHQWWVCQYVCAFTIHVRSSGVLCCWERCCVLRIWHGTWCPKAYANPPGFQTPFFTGDRMPHMGKTFWVRELVSHTKTPRFCVTGWLFYDIYWGGCEYKGRSLDKQEYSLQQIPIVMYQRDEIRIPFRTYIHVDSHVQNLHKH